MRNFSVLEKKPELICRMKNKARFQVRNGKLKNFKGDPWRIGDTYHTAIGQYGFQVTPMEMARAVALSQMTAKLFTPHLVLGDTAKENQVTFII